LTIFIKTSTGHPDDHKSGQQYVCVLMSSRSMDGCRMIKDNRTQQ
jgi:hypothetical protein